MDPLMLLAIAGVVGGFMWLVEAWYARRGGGAA